MMSIVCMQFVFSLGTEYFLRSVLSALNDFFFSFLMFTVMRDNLLAGSIWSSDPGSDLFC